MLCPRCNKHTLEEREKDGVTMDICQECRGIWLDRGELELLIARATQEMDRQAHTYSQNRTYPDQHDKHHGDHDRHHDERQKHHSYDDHHGHEGTHYKKRHWLAEIFD